jgi:hypothetical protein
MALVEMTPEGLMPRGRIGDVVFYKRNGRFFSRRYVIPRNPKTPAQMRQRERFRRAHEAWKLLSEQEKAEYHARARILGRYSGYQLFMSENTKNEKEAE